MPREISGKAIYLRLALTLTHIPKYPENAEQTAPRIKLIPAKMDATALLIWMAYWTSRVNSEERSLGGSRR